MTARGGEPPRCPRCGSSRILPIFYGLPFLDVAEQAERGELVLGGCIITGNDPDAACEACGARWRSGPPGS